MAFWRKRGRAPDAVARSSAGDSASLVMHLDRRYRRPLVSYFEKRIRETYDVDDLVQEVFIRLTYRSQREPIERMEAYVFQVAANVIRDRLRRRLSRRVADHEPLADHPEFTDDFSPERVLQSRQLLIRAIESLEELPSRTRHIFVLAQYEEMTQEDIAARLNLSVSGVRFLLRQAKAHVARRLEKDA